MDATEGYLLGLDIGGTTTRVLLADVTGRRCATATGPGGNPNSHPPAVAAARVGDALRVALAGIDPADVRAGVLGLAGYSTLNDPEVRRLFTEAWQAEGLRRPMRVVPDSVAAFAAATTAETGSVLIAGTGSAAVRVEGRALARTVGGHGWLLGDEGSAFWLGRQAVQLALAVLDERQRDAGVGATLLAAANTTLCGNRTRRRDRRETGFPESVLDAAIGAGWRDVPPRLAVELLITAVHAAPPIELAALAPLVSAGAERGDASAEALVRRAITDLAALLAATRTADERTPIVLSGSLLAPGNPIGDGLRARLDEHEAGPVCTATDAAAGAAWLAALDVLDAGPELAKSLHRKLLG